MSVQPRKTDLSLLPVNHPIHDHLAFYKQAKAARAGRETWINLVERKTRSKTRIEVKFSDSKNIYILDSSFYLICLC